MPPLPSVFVVVAAVFVAERDIEQNGLAILPVAGAARLQGLDGFQCCGLTRIGLLVGTASPSPWAVRTSRYLPKFAEISLATGDREGPQPLPTGSQAIHSRTGALASLCSSRSVLPPSPQPGSRSLRRWGRLSRDVQPLRICDPTHRHNRKRGFSIQPGSILRKDHAHASGCLRERLDGAETLVHRYSRLPQGDRGRQLNVSVFRGQNARTGFEQLNA
ncbi:hypothetical protein ACVWY5_006408 [Bradyrhizobium sp. USDA 3256]